LEDIFSSDLVVELCEKEREARRSIKGCACDGEVGAHCLGELVIGAINRECEEEEESFMECVGEVGHRGEVGESGVAGFCVGDLRELDSRVEVGLGCEELRTGRRGGTRRDSFGVPH
jgi:hypothetical protein